MLLFRPHLHIRGSYNRRLCMGWRLQSAPKIFLKNLPILWKKPGFGFAAVCEGAGVDGLTAGGVEAGGAARGDSACGAVGAV